MQCVPRTATTPHSTPVLTVSSIDFNLKSINCTPSSPTNSALVVRTPSEDMKGVGVLSCEVFYLFKMFAVSGEFAFILIHIGPKSTIC